MTDTGQPFPLAGNMPPPALMPSLDRGGGARRVGDGRFQPAASDSHVKASNLPLHPIETGFRGYLATIKRGFRGATP